MKNITKGKFKKNVQYDFADFQTFIIYLASMLEVKHLGKNITVRGSRLSESIFDLRWEEIIQIMYLIDPHFDWEMYLNRVNSSKFPGYCIDDLPF